MRMLGGWMEVPGDDVNGAVVRWGARMVGKMGVVPCFGGGSAVQGWVWRLL
jgi:hypothetical protein